MCHNNRDVGAEFGLGSGGKKSPVTKRCIFLYTSKLYTITTFWGVAQYESRLWGIRCHMAT